ncbi:MAG: bifunctional DNA primase/polymerase [Burkholderiales bacterium]|nr:bifunctional DNA primase/polymerase [Burkholderiales bacterium]
MKKNALAYSLKYAKTGFRVFPAHSIRDGRCTCGKDNCGSPGKHPRTKNGVHDATTVETEIRAWFKRWPDSNIGIALDDHAVVDEDPRNGGNVDDLPHKLPDTCCAKTGGGGRHFLYKAKNNARYLKSIAPGIDLKFGPGQYIIVEPSTHASGQSYYWLDDSEPWNRPPAEAPEWLASSKPQKKQAVASRGDLIKGERNNELAKIAGAMQRRGVSETTIESALLAENIARCKPPLPDAEVISIAKSIARYEPDAGNKGTGGLDFFNPVPTAQNIILAKYTDANDLLGLRYWQGEFRIWTGTHWAVIPNDDIREMLYRQATLSKNDPPVRKRQIDDVADAMRAFANLSDAISPPSWVPKEAGDLDPKSLISMENGFFSIEKQKLIAPSSRLFVTNYLPFAYNPNAAEPKQWLTFLSQIWPDDPESIQLLQQWFGYCLTQRTEQQKALLFISPKRGGKGTIARVLTILLGKDNVCSPSLASFGTTFGLQQLIGKTLALISDARLGGHSDLHVITENILRITGEDQISIPRKYLTDYTATLHSRIMVLTNEPPRFADGSGALPSRFVVLNSEVSFFGKEDLGLTAKLLTELPGIFNWALEGLHSLLAQGHFNQPKQAKELIDQIELLAAPVRAFINDKCETGNRAFEITASDLFRAWQHWCYANGREHPGTQQTFGRDLRAALPALQMTQHRVNGAPIRHYSGIRLLEVKRNEAQ